MNNRAWRTRRIRATLLGLIFGLSVIQVTADETSALKMDSSLRGALEKADKTSVEVLLDREFSWTDAAGKTRTKSETLSDFFQFASDNGGYSDVKANSYQRLTLTYGVKADVRFLRVWVRDGNQWKLFMEVDTPVGGVQVATPPPSTGDCDNPCRLLPYRAKTTAEQQVLSEWQKTKMDEWHPNASDWATHIADEFMLVNNISARNKEQRVAFAEKLQAAGISMPGDPITQMELKQFGDAMVMISHHTPYRGGKPYYNVRIFVNRDGHWPLVWSQQTTIKDAAAAPAVEANFERPYIAKCFGRGDREDSRIITARK